MKISRNKLKHLVEQSMKSVLVNEATKKANDWPEYVAVGKTPAEQNERRKLWFLWDLWTKPTQVQVELSTNPEVKLPVNPAEYAADYSGWVKWYKDMLKNTEAMASMGKKPGQHFSVADHFKYVQKFFPDSAKLPSMKLQAKQDAIQAAEEVKKMVPDFSLPEETAPKAKPSQQKKEEPSMNLSTEPSKNIFGFQEAPVTNGEGVSRAQSIEEFLTTRASAPAMLPLKTREQYPKQAALYAKNPTLFWKKANDKKLSPQEESKLATILKGDTETRTVQGEKENLKENKMMNENRIRAIIRHELIQSMKK